MNAVKAFGSSLSGRPRRQQFKSSWWGQKLTPKSNPASNLVFEIMAFNELNNFEHTIIQKLIHIRCYAATAGPGRVNLNSETGSDGVAEQAKFGSFWCNCRLIAEINAK